MNIREATQLLQHEKHHHHSFSTDLTGQAEQLGIEALSRLVSLRLDPRLSAAAPLPSETEDV